MSIILMGLINGVKYPRATSILFRLFDLDQGELYIKLKFQITRLTKARLKARLKLRLEWKITDKISVRDPTSPDLSTSEWNFS